jgi:hypothetical protein
VIRHTDCVFLQTTHLTLNSPWKRYVQISLRSVIRLNADRPGRNVGQTLIFKRESRIHLVCQIVPGVLQVQHESYPTRTRAETVWRRVRTRPCIRTQSIELVRYLLTAHYQLDAVLGVGQLSISTAESNH